MATTPAPEHPGHPRFDINGYPQDAEHPGVIACNCCCCVNYDWQIRDGISTPLKTPRYNCRGHCAIYAEWHKSKKSPVGRPKAEQTTEYAFTLTQPPDYESKKPIEEVARLIMTNGLTNKPYEKAERFAFVLEHTEKGTPHIHGVYKTPSGRRIASKYFQRYWPLWDEKVKMGHGHRGGYHQKARHEESYSAYMEKEGEVTRGPPPKIEGPLPPDLISPEEV